jgi:hypothetical protein
MKHPTEKRGRIHGDCHLCGKPTRWGVLRADGLVCDGCEGKESFGTESAVEVSRQEPHRTRSGAPRRDSRTPPNGSGRSKSPESPRVARKRKTVARKSVSNRRGRK